MNQKVMVRMLAKFGHRVTVVNDGREAVATFQAMDANQRFDCILMDIQMPHMSGVEASHIIRKTEKEKGWLYTPIIAVSAYVEDKVSFVQAGIDSYIAKPISQQILLETVHQFTSRASST